MTWDTRSTYSCFPLELWLSQLWVKRCHRVSWHPLKSCSGYNVGIMTVLSNSHYYKKKTLLLSYKHSSCLTILKPGSPRPSYQKTLWLRRSYVIIYRCNPFTSSYMVHEGWRKMRKGQKVEDKQKRIEEIMRREERNLSNIFLMKGICSHGYLFPQKPNSTYYPTGDENFNIHEF